MQQQAIYPQLKLPIQKTCQICGQPLKEEKLDLNELKEGHRFILEDVPVYICDSCDEIWIPQKVLDGFKAYTALRSVKHGGTKSQRRKVKT